MQLKKYLSISISLVTLALLINSCSNGQTQSSKSSLPPSEFSEKIKELPAAPVVDVRTPEEFGKGHLLHAQNFDWNGNSFDKQIAGLDKSKPVFVYCLSGGRSSAAANKMRAEGYKEVYELEGGIMKWRAANLPETTENIKNTGGMSRQQFNQLLESDKLVLIDFYADWCAPCKKMKPYLEEISKDMADQVIVIRINADDNQTLCKELQIDGLPVLQLYRNKALKWAYTGYIDKASVVKELK